MRPTATFRRTSKACSSSRRTSPSRCFARQTPDQLRQSAEAANRNKDEFPATLGHELRNPVAAILTAVAVMKQRGPGNTAREQRVIERQAKHLTRLVDDIVDISRIDCGKVELRTETLGYPTSSSGP
jgi:signal transduction histidine kinase